MDVAEEVGSELVVAGSEATTVFQAAEHALDGVATLVEDLADPKGGEANLLFQTRLRFGGMLGIAPCASIRSRMRLLA